MNYTIDNPNYTSQNIGLKSIGAHYWQQLTIEFQIEKGQNIVTIEMTFNFHSFIKQLTGAKIEECVPRFRNFKIRQIYAHILKLIDRFSILRNESWKLTELLTACRFVGFKIK